MAVFVSRNESSDRLLGLAGVAAVVGKIGGRRLPLVAADLLRFWLGARRYAGPPAQLVRGLPDGKAGEPPAPAQSLPDDEAGKAGGPGPLRLMARRARRVLRRRPRENKKRRKEGERRNGRMPLRWFGKRRRRKGGEGNNANAPVRKAGGNRAATRETRHRSRAGRHSPGGLDTHRPAVGPGRRALARPDRVRDTRAGPRTEDIRRGTTGVGRPGQGDPAGGHGPAPAGAGLRRT